MEILKFENAPAPRKAAPKKSNLKSLAGLATVAAIAVLGSTLAANISLGTGTGPLEFGQGVQVTAACDSGITISPQVTFKNISGGGTFYLSTISFTNVDARTANSASVSDGTNTGTGCAGKTLQLNAYGDSSATPLQLATASSVSGTPITTATIGITTTTHTTTTGLTVTTPSNQGTATSSFDLGFGAWPTQTSGAVAKLTIQSN